MRGMRVGEERAVKRDGEVEKRASKSWEELKGRRIRERIERGRRGSGVLSKDDGSGECNGMLAESSSA